MLTTRYAGMQATLAAMLVGTIASAIVDGERESRAAP